MHAKITRKGSEEEGYTVSLFLPVEWLARFNGIKGMMVFHQYLNSNWGLNGVRTESHIFIESITKELISCIKQEINAAKAALNEADFSEETIDLD